MRRLTGWLFDVYARGDGVSVWLIDGDGVSHHLHDRLTPSFFVAGAAADLRRVCEWLVRAQLPVRLKRTERYDLFARQNLVVLQVQVQIPAQYSSAVSRISDTFPSLDLYNADLSVPQFYFFERRLFPLAYCDVQVKDSEEIVEIATDDSIWDLHYSLPPLNTMFVQMDTEGRNPAHGHRGALEITYDDRTYVIRGADPREVIARVREHLLCCDPDVILTRWGDSFILPQLLQLARRFNVRLPLNRDQVQPQVRPARSYFSYNRIVHKTRSLTLRGRWHIDQENAFLLDYGFEGAIEISRLARQPPQQTVRVSTGTSISAMEMATAYAQGYLIPFRKREPEEFKSGRELLTADKGGLTYQPLVGLHFDVAELDFVSMYASIMARFNVSPETVRCRCCSDSRVPELGYSVCQRKRGLVPATVAPLIEKRMAYKRASRQAQSPTEQELYRRLASGIKWMLVVSFGYTGYKNARYGRIEAHEAITAYGRETLLRAKEIVEARGFRFLHGLTDSLWIQKENRGEGATQREEYEALAAEIERATSLPIEVEMYKWVAFLPSRVDARYAVPNRYFAAQPNGELKVRGIEVRRGDTPEFIKQVQSELLAELARTSTRTELAAALPRLMEIVAQQIDRLRAGQVPLQDLVLTYRLSRAPEDYRANTLNAIVARELAGRGVILEPGECVRYVITHNKADVPSDRARSYEFLDGSCGYDVERYIELLLRAVETVTTPLGVNARMLQNWLTKELPADHLRTRFKSKKPQAYLGPLFEFVA